MDVNDNDDVFSFESLEKFLRDGEELHKTMIENVPECEDRDKFLEKLVALNKAVKNVLIRYVREL